MSPNYYTIPALEGERIAYTMGRDDLAQAFSRLIDAEAWLVEQDRQLEDMQERIDSLQDALCSALGFIENYRNDYPTIAEPLIYKINAIIGE